MKIGVNAETQTAPQRRNTREEMVSIRNTMNTVVEEDMPSFKKTFSKKSSLRSLKGELLDEQYAAMGTKRDIMET